MKKNNSNVRVFFNEEFGQVRTVVDSCGEPWFCLRDVCVSLGLKVNGVVRRLGDGVISNHPIDTETRGVQRFRFVNEDGLYDTIFESRKPEAKAFRKWVTGEVLPQIRKTGGYIPVTAEDTPERIEEKSAMVLRRTLAQKDAIIADQDRQIAEQRQMAQLGEAVCGTKGGILLRDLAKLLTQNGIVVGQQRLFAWLRRHGYIFQQGTSPRQEWVERGIFEVRVNASRDREHLTTLVTGRGQEYFINGFLDGKLLIDLL